MHFSHVSVSTTVDRATVNVVSIIRLVEDEDANITHGAKVNVLSHLVLDEPFIDERVEDPLYRSCQK